MRLLLVSVYMLIAVSAFSQISDDSTQVGKLACTGTYQPVLSLTKADIERLPASGFMELVNGAFNFAFSDPLLSKNYTFIIDGFITLNPNAINLSQIQKIEFYPAGTPAAYGSSMKSGTFIISTLDGLKNTADFSTKTGILMPNDNGTSLPSSSMPKKDKKYPAIFSLNEANYAVATSKTKISSALSYLRSGVPHYSYYFFDEELKSKSSLNRWRFSNMVQHQLSNKLSLQAGLLFVHYKDKLENNGGPEFGNNQSSNNQRDYIGASAALLYQPLKKLQNTFSVEVNGYKEKKSSMGSRKGQLTYFTLTNQTSYDLISAKDFYLKTDLLLNFMSIKENNTWYSSQYAFTPKNLQAIPGIYTNWKNILQANLNVKYARFSQSTYTEEQPLLPNFGLQVNLKNAFLKRKNNLSELSISSNYNKFRNGLVTYDMLDMDDPSSYLENVYYDRNPGNRWLNSLNIGFLKDRIALKLNYLTVESLEPVRTIEMPSTTNIPPIAGIPLSSRIFYLKLKNESKGLELRVKILEQSRLKWSVQGNIFSTKSKLKQNEEPDPSSSTQFPIMPRPSFGNIYNGGIIFRDGSIVIPIWSQYVNVNPPDYSLNEIINKKKAHWTGGLRTNLEWNRMFLQASAMFDFNDEKINANGLEYFSNHTLNHLLAGYKFQLPSTKYVKGLELSLQTRNLIKRKQTMPNSLRYPYYGVGVNIAF